MILDSQDYFLPQAWFNVPWKGHDVSNPDYNIDWAMGARHWPAKPESSDLIIREGHEVSHNAFFTLP